MIRRHVVENVGPFVGRHEVVYGATTYGVVAVDEASVGRSNALGKTTWLSTIPLALFDWWDERTTGWRRDDDWITRGEERGSIALELDDGTSVVRTRERGSPTTLTVRRGDRTWVGVPAQHEILRTVVGLEREDFFATFFVQQKQAARFVTCTPSERQALIAGWLRLDFLQRCAASVAHDLGELFDERARVAAAHAADAEWMNNAVRTYGLASSAELAEALPRRVEVFLEEERRATERIDALRAEQAAHAAKVRRDVVVAKGRAAVVELKQFSPPTPDQLAELRKARDGAAAERARAATAEDRARQLARGEFDGVCPVAGIECPAKDAINRDGEANRRRHEEAMRVEATARVNWEACTRSLQAAEREEREAAVRRECVRDLMEEAKVLAPAAARATGEDPEARVVTLANEFANLRARRVVVERDAHELVARAERAAAAEERLAAIDHEVGVIRWAASVFGERGAQRVISERAVAEIDADANDSLARAGIDLRVGVRWSREGDGLASSCELCGSAFPASRKVRSCSRCGTERGPKRVEKTEVELSKRSGAMDDMAGFEYRAAAARWLRAARGIPWDVLFADEPVGALDAAHRRSFARQLAHVTSGGIRQAFVVAHHPEVVDALPGRVEVRWSGGKPCVTATT